MGVDKSRWVEVVVKADHKLVVPEWDTVRVHTGQRVRLPPAYVAAHPEWFEVIEVVGVKPTKPMTKHMFRALVDLKPEEI